MRIRGRAVAVVLLVLLLGILAGCFMPDPIPDPIPDPPSSTYRVTVGQILAEFEANEVAGELKYENQLVAVTGYIHRISTYWNDEPIVVLGVSAGGSSFDPEVLCYFPVSQRAEVALLSPGDYLTIVGEYWMYGLGNVYVHYCYIE